MNRSPRRTIHPLLKPIPSTVESQLLRGFYFPATGRHLLKQKTNQQAHTPLPCRASADCWLVEVLVLAG